MSKSDTSAEIREKIAQIIHQTDDDWGGGGFEECLKSADIVLQLITSYTKQRELALLERLEN